MESSSSEERNEEEHYDPTKDPYVTSFAIDSALDVDDHIIRADDMIILSGVSEEDQVSHLDLCIYEQNEENIYTHHDYLLSAFPLSMTWLDYPIGSPDKERMNLVAVSTFEAFIEIWDLDQMNTYPIVILGGPENKKHLNKKKGYKLASDSHQDSILGLSWNKNQRNALASASADKTVKLWDLQSCTCVRTFNYHSDKVQSCEWNPVEGPLLATGGFDSKIIVTDVRLENAIMTVQTDSEIESLHWLPQPLHNFLLASFENGMVKCYDVLQNMKLVWQLSAHSKPCHALAVNPSIPGLIATGAPEHENPVKIWDVSSGTPTCLYSKTSSVGPTFSISFSPDSPFILAVGTQNTLPKCLDISQFPTVREKYSTMPSYPENKLDFGSINYTVSTGVATTSNNFVMSNVKKKKKKKKEKKII